VECRGSGINEVGLSGDGKTLVKVSKEFFRPLESDNYKVDYSKGKKKLRCEPETKFKGLVRIMIESDLRNLK
jgi:GDPmannose 4,6-dehydratase